MLRHLPAVALEALLAVFNSLWESGVLPDAWREATIIPILKPGKSGLDPLHYRPISLTSSLCKLMEKMVNARLNWFLEHHNVLANAQCGFRKHRSAVDHILALDTEARACFSQKKHLGAVFFDIEAAYDTVLRHGILLKLHNYGVRGRMGAFLQSFLSHRHFRVRVGGHLSNSFPQENGIPQGGVLSVALFAVMINDIGDELPTAVGRSLLMTSPSGTRPPVPASCPDSCSFPCHALKGGVRRTASAFRRLKPSPSTSVDVAVLNPTWGSVCTASQSQHSQWRSSLASSSTGV